MNDDFLQQLGYLAVATRLKRISDRMIHSGRELYKTLGLDIEPNWYMIFKLLEAHHQLAVTEIATRLQLSHPSVIAIIEKMTKKGYLESSKCEADGRRQLISLTDTARESLPHFQAIWEAGQQGIADMCEGYDLLSLLDTLDGAVASSSFKDRTLHHLQVNQ